MDDGAAYTRRQTLQRAGAAGLGLTTLGAGLDALRQEPPRHGSPLLDLNLANLIITPHVAWASREAVQTLADQVIDNIEAFVSGRPQNLLA